MSERVKEQTGGYADGGGAGDDQGGVFNGAQGGGVAGNEVGGAVEVLGTQDGGVGGQQDGFNGVQGAGVAGIHGGSGGGGYPVGDVIVAQGVNSGDTWVNCLNGAFQKLTAALRRINLGLTEIAAQGNPNHEITVNEMRVEYNNINQRAGQIKGTIVDINTILGTPHDYDRIPVTSAWLQFINQNVKAINAAGCAISVGLGPIVSAQGYDLGLNRAASRVHDGLGTLNEAMAIFQSVDGALGQPNLFGADNVAVPAAVAHLNAAAAGGNEV